MSTENEQPERSLFRSWVRVTMWGWLIGLVLVVGMAIVWDVFGGGAQFMVGVGMGAGVGYMQARVAKAWTGGIRPWLWTSVIGMGAPFIVSDIGSAAGVAALYSLPVCVLVGGLLTGALQRRLLRPRFERTSWWIPACVVGWGLPAAAAASGFSDLLPPAFRLLSTIVIFFGGLVLGAVTGKTLQWMSPSNRSDWSTQPPGIGGG